MTRYEQEQRVLHSAFDIDVHKKTFINYCEVCILPTGEICYAVPSHSEFVYWQLYNKKHNITMTMQDFITKIRYSDAFMNEAYDDTDYDMTKAANILGIILVWSEQSYTPATASDKAKQSLQLLIDNGLTTNA